MARVVNSGSPGGDDSSNRSQDRYTKPHDERDLEDEQVLLISQAFQQSITQVEQRRGRYIRTPRLPVGFSANIFQGEQFAFVGTFNDEPLKTAKMMVELVGGQVVELDMHPTRIITGRDIPKRTSDKISRITKSREGLLSHSLRDFMLLFFELSRSSRAAKSTVEPAVEATVESAVEPKVEPASDGAENRADELTSTLTTSRDASPERVSSEPRIQSSRASLSVPKQFNDLPKPLFYDKQYQPWDIYIDEAIPESIRDRLAQQISTNGGRLVSASQADIILFDPHHPTHPSGPTATDINPGANLRPWHWVFFCLQERKLLKTCLMGSQVPIFVKRRNETEPYGEQGGMLACWLADKVPSRPKLERMILSYGGLITRRRQNALIFIVDPNSSDRETLDIIHVYSHDRSRYVLSYDWVTTCVELGEIARLPKDSSSNAPVLDGRSNHRFTADDDRKLVRFIAQELFDQDRLPRKGQRLGDKGNKIYQLLVSETYKPEEPRPWAFNHPWESWRTRYKNQAHLGMERDVQKAIGRLQQGLSLESPSSPQHSSSGSSSSSPASFTRLQRDTSRINTLRKGKNRAVENLNDLDNSDHHNDNDDDDDDYQDYQTDRRKRIDEVYVPPSRRPKKTISEMMAPFRPSRHVQRSREVENEPSPPSLSPPPPPSKNTVEHEFKLSLVASQHSPPSIPEPIPNTIRNSESINQIPDDGRDEFDRIQIQTQLELEDEDDVEGTLGDPNFESASDVDLVSESALEYPGEATQRVNILMDDFLNDRIPVEADPIGVSQDPSESLSAKRKRDNVGFEEEEDDEEEGPETYRLRMLLDDHLRSQTQTFIQAQGRSSSPEETGWE